MKVNSSEFTATLVGFFFKAWTKTTGDLNILWFFMDGLWVVACTTGFIWIVFFRDSRVSFPKPTISAQNIPFLCMPFWKWLRSHSIPFKQARSISKLWHVGHAHPQFLTCIVFASHFFSRWTLRFNSFSLTICFSQEKYQRHSDLQSCDSVMDSFYLQNRNKHSLIAWYFSRSNEVIHWIPVKSSINFMPHCLSYRFDVVFEDTNSGEEMFRSHTGRTCRTYSEPAQTEATFLPSTDEATSGVTDSSFSTSRNTRMLTADDYEVFEPRKSRSKQRGECSLEYEFGYWHFCSLFVSSCTKCNNRWFYISW